jgi:hypothetical protein
MLKRLIGAKDASEAKATDLSTTMPLEWHGTWMERSPRMHLAVWMIMNDAS